MSASNFVDSTDHVLLIDTTLGTTITNNNVFRLPVSEVVVASFIQNGIFAGRFAAPDTTPPGDTSLIWPDKNVNPTVHKYWDGAAWVQAAFTDVWNFRTYVLDNFTATAAPTANDDSDDGYGVGSLWVNIATDISYICADASVGAAVWTNISAGAGGGISNLVEDITPQLGGDLDLNSNSIIGSTDGAGARVDITARNIRLGGADLSSGIQRPDKIGAVLINGGDSQSDGAAFIAFGSAHASQASDWEARTNAGAVTIRFDASADDHFVFKDWHPDTNNIRDLGSTSLRWKKAWVVDLDVSGTVTLGNGVLQTAYYADASVTFSKMVSIAQNEILGRTSAGSGDIEPLSATQIRSILNVEDGATADQTDGEIETAYNNQVSIVSQAEAEAGTATTVRRWTAQRVAQAIAALAPGGGTSLVDFKESVRVATDVAGTLATSFENGDTVDGVTLATGDRILIKDQATGAENGIYTVNASGAPTRATDADADAEVTAGLLVAVEEGTANGDKIFMLTTNDPITVGTTALTFAATGGSGEANLATNVGSGADIFRDKTGVTLNFRGISAESGVLTAAVNVDNVDIAVATGGIGTAKLADLGVTTAKIADDNVTYAKIQNVSATQRLLGRNTAGAGDIEELAPATARTLLGLVIGTDVQAQNDILQDIAGLTQTADRGIYFDTSTTAALFVLTAAGRALLDDADAAAQRTTLGVDPAGTDNAPTASTTVSGKVELATVAEIDTGTDNTRAVTPDGLAGSDHGIRYVALEIFEPGTAVTTGDGKRYLHIPPGLDGWDIVYVHAEVVTAGTPDTTDVQIHELVGAVDVLSTKLTIDSGETGSDTAAVAAVINTANDDVATNDTLRIDVDAVSTTTPPQGLTVTIGFRKP